MSYGKTGATKCRQSWEKTCLKNADSRFLLYDDVQKSEDYHDLVKREFTAFGMVKAGLKRSITSEQIIMITVIFLAVLFIIILAGGLGVANALLFKTISRNAPASPVQETMMTLARLGLF